MGIRPIKYLKGNMCEPGLGKIALKGTPLLTGPVNNKKVCFWKTYLNNN